MSEQIRQIAQRIRELREISGLSMESLAKEFKISVEQYEQYESGDVDIPVSFLYEAANKFNVELTAILTGEGPKLHTYSLVRKGKGLNVERRKQYKYQNLAFNFAPIHYNSHPGQEFNYVLEGTLKVSINGHDIILSEGDSLFFDSNANHGMKAMNNQTARFLAIIF